MIPERYAENSPRVREYKRDYEQKHLDDSDTHLIKHSRYWRFHFQEERLKTAGLSFIAPAKIKFNSIVCLLEFSILLAEAQYRPDGNGAITDGQKNAK